MEYEKEVFFYLPGAFDRWYIYDVLLAFYKDRNYYFYNNAKIGALYGAPCGAIWNGGRGDVGSRMNRTELNNDKEFLNSLNIPFRFTFTNSLIEKKHLEDEYCNIILDIFKDGNNEIICNSNLLENYIRQKYNNDYNYISSTTKCILDKKEIEKELNNYSLTVIDYNYNNNYDFLKKISKPEKIELLVNPVCEKKCPRRKEHYEFISKSQLLGFIDDDFECPYQGRLFYEAQKNELFISKEKINEWYIKHGFVNFKLEGRTAKDFDLIEMLVYYLIKDEYKEEAREILLAKWQEMLHI